MSVKADQAHGAGEPRSCSRVLCRSGVIAGHGSAQDMIRSSNPFVHQFVHAEPDGPVAFHYPGGPLAADFEVPAAR